MEWRSISNKYECSDDGHIRNKKTKRILKEYNSCRDGYLRTQFDGKTRTVHRVIAKAFLPSDATKPYVNHKDGDKRNNHVDNLEWCTFSENIRHAYATGLNKGCPGEKNGHNILSHDDVIQIRNIYKPRDKEYGAKSLGKKYNVNPRTISAVALRRSWKDL